MNSTLAQDARAISRRALNDILLRSKAKLSQLETHIQKEYEYLIDIFEDRVLGEAAKGEYKTSFTHLTGEYGHTVLKRLVDYVENRGGFGITVTYDNTKKYINCVTVSWDVREDE